MTNPVEAGRALADALAAETARRDLNQREAAAIVGAGQQTFGKWINGQNRPGDQFIPAIAKYLGMTEDKVRQLRGSMRPDPRSRMDLKRRVDQLEAEMAEVIGRLESVALRLDALDD